MRFFICALHLGYFFFQTESVFEPSGKCLIKNLCAAASCRLSQSVIFDTLEMPYFVKLFSIASSNGFGSMRSNILPRLTKRISHWFDLQFEPRQCLPFAPPKIVGAMGYIPMCSNVGMAAVIMLNIPLLLSRIPLPRVSLFINKPTLFVFLKFLTFLFLGLKGHWPPVGRFRALGYCCPHFSLSSFSNEMLSNAPDNPAMTCPIESRNDGLVATANKRAAISVSNAASTAATIRPSISTLFNGSFVQ